MKTSFRICAAASLTVLTATTSTFAATCSTIGPQNTVVLLVLLPGQTPPATPQFVSDVFFGTSTGRSLDGFWREASYGQTSATGNVYGWYTLSGTYSCLNLPQLMDDAIAAASAQGVNFQGYTRIFTVMPNLSCGWVGLTLMSSSAGGCSTWSTPAGTLTASASFVASIYFGTAYTPGLTLRDQAVALVSHEGGHALGLSHAGTVTDSPLVLGPVGSAGSFNDMGDRYDTMGGWDLGLYTAQHKAEVLNWMTPGSSYKVVQSSGSYTLQPLEISPPGLQALKVQRGTGTNAWLWVEYRQPIGNYDSALSAQAFSGALIHYKDSTTIAGQPHLVDFTPGDSSWSNAALAVGQTWTDPYSNLILSVESATSTGLNVTVGYGAASCVLSTPAVNISPAGPSLYAGQSASYTVSVTDQDSSACSPVTINLGSSSPSGWSTSFSATSLTLGPGQSGSVTMSKGAPAGTAPGTYAVNVTAAENSLVGSAAASVTVVAPPSLAASLSVSGPIFAPPQTASFTANVINGGVGVSGATVKLTMIKANGSKVTQTVTANSAGTASWSYKVSKKDPPGAWSATAEASFNSQTATTNTVSFTVQ